MKRSSTLSSDWYKPWVVRPEDSQRRAQQPPSSAHTRVDCLRGRTARNVDCLRGSCVQAAKNGMPCVQANKNGMPSCVQGTKNGMPACGQVIKNGSAIRSNSSTRAGNYISRGEVFLPVSTSRMCAGYSLMNLATIPREDLLTNNNFRGKSPVSPLLNKSFDAFSIDSNNNDNSCLEENYFEQKSIDVNKQQYNDVPKSYGSFKSNKKHLNAEKTLSLPYKYMNGEELPRNGGHDSGCNITNKLSRRLENLKVGASEEFGYDYKQGEKEFKSRKGKKTAILGEINNRQFWY